MNVVAFVGNACLLRLERALGSDTLRRLASLNDLQRELDAGHADVGVIDLDACREAHLTVLTKIVSDHGASLIAYGVFAPSLVRTMTKLARHGLCHLIFRGVDDCPSYFNRALRDAAGTRLSVEIVERLSPILSGASSPVRDAIAQLFHEPLRFRCAVDIAQTAGITRRSLDRTLCTLELEPARTFLLAAHLTWAYPRIRSAHATVGDVSRQLGISKPERFAQHTRLLLGLPPSAVRTQVVPYQFIQMIVGRLTRQPRPGVAAVAYDQGCSTLTSPTASQSGEHVLTS